MLINSSKNKKGVVMIFVFVILSMVAVYLLLYLPFSPLVKLRAIINYLLILISWFLIQALLIYGYYRLGKLALVGFAYYKTGITKISERTKNLFDVK